MGKGGPFSQNNGSGFGKPLPFCFFVLYLYRFLQEGTGFLCRVQKGFALLDKVFCLCYNDKNCLAFVKKAFYRKDDRYGKHSAAEWNLEY